MELTQLIKARAHIGDQTSYWNPKMFKYIYREKEGRHIIDVVQTVKALNEAKNFVRNACKSGKTFLFVGTKPQAIHSVAHEADECGSYYVNYKWLGGMLTNWTTVKIRIDRLKELEEKEVSGLLNTLPKKELSKARKELAKLRRYLKGIKHMTKSPDILIVVDPTLEMTAVREAIVLGLPIIALMDTNGNPDMIDFPIPCNDDSILTISLILSQFSDLIKFHKSLND